jgi:iron(III) transport system permease protein
LKEEIIFNSKIYDNLNIWLISSIFLAFLISIPLLVIVFSSIKVNNQIWNHIYDYLIFFYLSNSLFLLLGVSLLTCLMGVLAAWFIVFYNIPFKKLISTLLILPIAIPPYAMAYCYADLTDKQGVINNIFFILFSNQASDILPSFRSLFGAIFVLSLTLFPYVFLIVKYSFQNNALKIIESAANLGATKLKLFFNFALPVARPALVAGIALVVMESLADFGVVHYLGVNSLSVGVYKAWFGFDDINSSARLALILLTFTLSIILIEKYFRRKKRENYATFGSYSDFNILFNSKTIFPIIFLTILIALSLIIPISWLISNLKLHNFENLNEIISAALNSIKLALFGALIIVTFATIIIFAKRISKLDFLSFILNFSKIGYAAPGIVIAIGIITPTIFLDKKINSIFNYFGKDVGLIMSGSIAILIFAYLVRFLSVAFNPIESGMEKISEKIDYSALNLGASKNDLFFKVHFPMIFTTCLIGFLLIFIDILKELPITLILRPYNFNTLSVLTFEYASSEQLVLASLPSLLITAIGLVPLIFIDKIINYRIGKYNEHN